MAGSHKPHVNAVLIWLAHKHKPDENAVLIWLVLTNHMKMLS